jgi:hypothetical protein
VRSRIQEDRKRCCPLYKIIIMGKIICIKVFLILESLVVIL